ncbi:hypothetical protein SAMN05660653_02242 [Desulfonatronum thiosulfatophilum]|uniref:DUF2241 domain-containing protein n=2 Tax=Desulfonatronum thiosulfatophilum TaxID=617002 RepID=A0A1G6DL07_9BACT|nr:hypothetical protein SAMN05660653_02242 [Desulfonatronum thiosulfatophilum]
MNAETELQTLIATMKPSLHAQPYVFCSIDEVVFARLPFIPLGTFHEPEGVTIIATREQASDSGLEFDMSWACVTLEVRSSLMAVGFLALITARLARTGISVKPVSAFQHDQLFVPW